MHGSKNVSGKITSAGGQQWHTGGQTTSYEGDVGKPTAHAQEKQKETHRQTEEQRGDFQGKEDEQVSAQTPVQTDNQTEKGNSSKGRQRIGSDQRILLERKRGNPK